MTTFPTIPPIPVVAIYAIRFPSPAQRIVLLDTEDTKVVLDPGPLNLMVAAPMPLPGTDPGKAGYTLAGQNIRRPEGCYLVTSRMIRSDAPPEERRSFSLRAAEIVSVVAVAYPNAIIERVYEGVLSGPGRVAWFAEHPLTITAQRPADPEKMLADLRAGLSANAGLDEQMRSRFRLSARWYARGQCADSPIDQFIYLWTALEVHPAEGSSRVPERVADYLSIALSRDPRDLKSRLWLGRLYDVRCKIVHDGHDYVAPDDQAPFTQYLDRLKVIVSSCLGRLVGLSPAAPMFHYLDEDPQEPPPLWRRTRATPRGCR